MKGMEERGAKAAFARLTFFTRRQTWWPWMDRLYREAQESTRSTTATKQAGVRPTWPRGQQRENHV